MLRKFPLTPTTTSLMPETIAKMETKVIPRCRRRLICFTDFPYNLVMFMALFAEQRIFEEAYHFKDIAFMRLGHNTSTSASARSNCTKSIRSHCAHLICSPL